MKSIQLFARYDTDEDEVPESMIDALGSLGFYDIDYRDLPPDPTPPARRSKKAPK